MPPSLSCPFDGLRILAVSLSCSLDPLMSCWFGLESRTSSNSLIVVLVWPIYASSSLYFILDCSKVVISSFSFTLNYLSVICLLKINHVNYSVDLAAILGQSITRCSKLQSTNQCLYWLPSIFHVVYIIYFKWVSLALQFIYNISCMATYISSCFQSLSTYHPHLFIVIDWVTGSLIDPDDI